MISIFEAKKDILSKDFEITAKDGYVAAMGIESPGLSASPAIAEYVRDAHKRCFFYLYN